MISDHPELQLAKSHSEVLFGQRRIKNLTVTGDVLEITQQGKLRPIVKISVGRCSDLACK